MANSLPLNPSSARLYDEIHARPFPKLKVETSIWHLVMLTEHVDPSEIRSHIATLDPRLENLSQSDIKNSALFQTLDDFEFRWEQHREFCTYTFITPIPNDAGLLTHRCPIPDQWLQALPGQAFLTIDIKLLPESTESINRQQLKDHFEGQTIAASKIVDGKASIWTSFKQHSDQSARYVIFADGLSQFQMGRTVQRALEIETYRIMALMGFPIAQDIASKLKQMHSRLSNKLETLTQLSSIEDEQEFLLEITNLAAVLENIILNTTHRFTATAAYYQIVQDRLASLREEKIPGISTLNKFLDRRLHPAMRTCEYIKIELNALSIRVTQATDLLRTRVDLTMKSQNQALMTALNRRSELQLRLQQTVEGLSVVAITYYAVSLIRKLAEAGQQLSASAPHPDLVAGAAIIPVGLGVWGVIRRIRRHTSPSTVIEKTCED